MKGNKSGHSLLEFSKYYELSSNSSETSRKGQQREESKSGAGCWEN